jgi:hypothetical protein
MQPLDYEVQPKTQKHYGCAMQLCCYAATIIAASMVSDRFTAWRLGRYPDAFWGLLSICVLGGYSAAVLLVYVVWRRFRLPGSRYPLTFLIITGAASLLPQLLLPEFVNWLWR